MADKPLTYSGMEETDPNLKIPAGGKEFPTCPEGLHSAEIVSARFRLTEKTYEGQTKVVPQGVLTFKVDQEYEDEETGEKRPYLVSTFPTLSASDKSNLFAFFKDTCGIPVPVKDGNIAITRVTQYDEKKEKDVVNMPQFIGLKCKVLVKHNESKDGSKVYANIENYIVDSKEQKKANAALFADSDSDAESDEEEDAPKKSAKKA